MGCYSSFVIVIHRTASSSALHHVARAPAGVPADFYGASALLPLTDDEIVQRLKSHIETCEPGFKDATVIDSAVLRFPKAVTHFSPGSYPSRPYQVTGIPNCFLAGDWVKGVSGAWAVAWGCCVVRPVQVRNQLGAGALHVSAQLLLASTVLLA